MHKAIYTERTEIEKHYSEWLVTRIITAWWNGHSLDVYKEYDNGECCERNIYNSYYAGRVIAFPGEPYSQNSYAYYYGSGTATTEDWQSCKRMFFVTDRHYFTAEEESKIIALYPDFKYVLKKWENATTSKAMEVLPLWKKFPEVELLLATGFEKIAMNKSFYRLRIENKKKIIKWIQKNPKYKHFTLQQIQIVVKYDINEKQYAEYIDFLNTVYGSHGCKYETFIYLKKHNIADSQNLSLYRDYIALVKQTEHSLKETYWLYPNNLTEAHAKILEEVAIIKKTKEERERKELESKLSEITNKAALFNTEIDGYSIFVTNNMGIWEEQAKQLHQCIIHCNYAEKMAKGDLILVFIQKKGIPIATAEIKKDLTLGQFYADEHSGTPNGSMPTKEVQDVFQKYFVTLNKKIFSKKRKEKQYA